MDLLTGPLGEPFMQRSLAAMFLIGISSGVMGAWMILYGYSYAGESIAHSAYPGIALAAIAGVPLIAGGIPAVLIAALLIAVAVKQPSVDRDTAVAAVVIGFFGAGGLLMLAPGMPGNAERLLFGDVLATSGWDLVMAAGAAVLVVAGHTVLRSRFLAVAFDPAYARATGTRVARHEAVILMLLAVTVLIGVQALGNLLVIALLVAPAATALHLTSRHARVFAISVCLAIAAGVAGLYSSYHFGGAAGASIAVVALGLYALTALGEAAYRHISTRPRGSRAPA